MMVLKMDIILRIIYLRNVIMLEVNIMILRIMIVSMRILVLLKIIMEYIVQIIYPVKIINNDESITYLLY